MPAALSPDHAGHAILDTPYLRARIDEFVITVTERLCLLEKENPSTMQDALMQSRKERILDCLDKLDGMMARLRSAATRPGASALD